MCQPKAIGPRCHAHALIGVERANSAYDANPTDENEEALEFAVLAYNATPTRIKQMKLGIKEAMGKDKRTQPLVDELREAERYRAEQRARGFADATEATDLELSKEEQLILVRSDEATPELLASLADSKYLSVREAVAADRTTPTETLALLATDWDDSIRARVAENPATPPEALDDIAGDQEPNGYGLREKVAKNPNAAEQTLLNLCDLKSEDLRDTLARSETAPQSVLHRLSNDDDHFVRTAVMKNPKAGVAVLMNLREVASLPVSETLTQPPNVAAWISELDTHPNMTVENLANYIDPNDKKLLDTPKSRLIGYAELVAAHSRV